MRSAGHGMAALLCCACVCIAVAFPARTWAAGASAPASTAAQKPAESQPPPDPFGRSTPYGTVIGFLRAAESGDYKAASRYLEGKQSAEEKEQRARDLAVVLNRGVRIGVDDLSRAPEGQLGDNPSPYLEDVGTATYGDKKLEIVLRRTTRSDTPPIWLFSAETLAGVRAAAEHLDLAWAEALWPERFREIRLFSFPLFRLGNMVVSLVIALTITWLLTLGLVSLLRPWTTRHALEFGESALPRLKWLLWLLIFAGIGRFVAQQSVTATGRIFFDYVATVLMIVAICWLLVLLTKLLTRSKIYHLRQASSPGKIAGVELFSWLLVCVWVVAGLFLILRSSGVELTAAVAGLGVGTIAIAFAAQKTLENLFGTVMVVSDDVVKVGDFCQAGTIEGRVESIGLRSTRIRTLDRTVVSIPNGQLAAMTIGNLARRDKSLFRHAIRLRCETTSAQIRAILTGTTDILSGHPRLESATVRARLIQLGDTGLELEAFAYVLTQEAEIFLQVQEELLLQIMNVIEASGTAIATPPKVTITGDGLGAVVDQPVAQRLAAPAASAGKGAPKVS